MIAAPAPSQVSSAGDTPALVRRFEKLSTRTQEKILAAVRSAVLATGDPWMKSIQGVAARAREHREAGSCKLPWPIRRKKSTARAPVAAPAIAVPDRARYVFGLNKIVAGETLAKWNRKNSGKRKREKRNRVAQLRSLLSGHAPDLDLTVATLLAGLDTDRSADPFATFLESWRNGEESFYEALDRTSGTSQSVFIYDAMLGEFVRSFVPKHHADHAKVRRSLDDANTALRQSFLAYRQYRAFREAVAWSLVLSPDVPLPAHLARYDKVDGYSLRDMVTMLLAAFDQNVDAVVNLVTKTAAPLPSPLWSAGYDPFEKFNAAFARYVPKMSEIAGGHTDLLLASERKTLAEVSRRTADKAHEALRDALQAAAR